MIEPKHLLTYHNGNGLTVYSATTIIAHISPNRVISYHKTDKIITDEDIIYIKYIAKNDDRNISYTQEQKVFNTRPNENRNI